MVVALATIFPLGIASLLAEGVWDAGLRYPRGLDWNESRALAAIIARNHLNNRLLWVYETSMGPSLAVFTPVVLFRGHWVEVQPRHDPADDLSAGAQAYVWPLAPGDSGLEAFTKMGLVRVYGGTADDSVFTLTHPGDPIQLAPIVERMLEQNARCRQECDEQHVAAARSAREDAHAGGARRASAQNGRAAIRSSAQDNLAQGRGEHVPPSSPSFEIRRSC